MAHVLVYEVHAVEVFVVGDGVGLEVELGEGVGELGLGGRG